MKYKVLATSIVTHLGRTLAQGDIVGAEVFEASHIPELVSSKSIEEVPNITTTKSKKATDNGETV
jgi:hypothetical protein